MSCISCFIVFERRGQQEKVCTFCDIVVNFCFCVLIFIVCIYYFILLMLLIRLNFSLLFFPQHFGQSFAGIYKQTNKQTPISSDGLHLTSTTQHRSAPLSLSLLCEVRGERESELKHRVWPRDMSSRRVMQRSYSGDGRTGLNNGDDVSGSSRPASRSYLSDVRPESR